LTGEAEIERIALGLIDCTLPKPEWTHRAHFAAALWLLAHTDVLANAGGMAPLIRAYNEATGGENTDSAGYHETITQASLRGADRGDVAAGTGTDDKDVVVESLISHRLPPWTMTGRRRRRHRCCARSR
jgi:hypothetical protein